MLEFNYRKQLVANVSVVVILIVLITIQGLNDVFYSGRCDNYFGGKVWRCLDVALFEKHQSVSLISISFLFSLIPLFFLKEQIYLSWRKFALVYIPLAVIAIHAAPESGDMLFDISKETVTMFSAGLFFILSLILILITSIKLRKK